MQKMNWLFLGMALLFSGPTFSGTIESFCQEVMSPRSEKKVSLKNSGKFLAKFIFSPESLVTINKTSSSLSIKQENGPREKMAFLLLPLTELDQKEKAELSSVSKQRKTILKRLKKQHFFSDLKKISESSECVSYIQKNHFEETLSELSQIAPRFIELKQKEIEEISYKEQIKKKKFLKKEGWKVFENLSLLEVHDLISRTKPNDVLLITHASQDGKIYDSFKNPFPRMFFSSLDIENLILYSCYGEESQMFYNFGNFNLYTVAPTPFAEQFLSESVPLNSLKAISKIKLQSLLRPYDRKCIFEVPSIRSNKLGAFLNGHFLGALNSTITFSCSILDKKNEIEIYSVLKERHQGEVGISWLLFNGVQIDLKDYLTGKNRHIVTKGLF